MLWGKKEDKKRLPDLPAFKPAQTMSQPLFPAPPAEDEKHSLPTFPDSPSSNKFSQAAIKDAVSPMQDFNEQNNDKKINVVEMDDWAPSMNQRDMGAEEEFPIVPKLEETEKTLITPIAPKPTKQSILKGSDVFIKIDKYQTLRRMLDETKTKLDEMESLIKNVRDTRMREEQELSGWEKEVMHAKSKIQEVSQTVFEKVD